MCGFLVHVPCTRHCNHKVDRIKMATLDGLGGGGEVVNALVVSSSRHTVSVERRERPTGLSGALQSGRQMAPPSTSCPRFTLNRRVMSGNERTKPIPDESSQRPVQAVRACL